VALDRDDVAELLKASPEGDGGILLAAAGRPCRTP
jgi:hypothetical protein